ncbi:PEGA domain-containing protein [Thermococcus sp. GR6]|uniref:PEGA domain-containing protein n=1 Tax=Thermococcus sp. GR6 TaxID=1638256 RepID=UPI001431E6EA|nr:PEGA domain-containing protein [Thermococcus sp. GR6]NJE42778.1 PEGA domain-containing protein [Thermococcus sp. GR6]
MKGHALFLALLAMLLITPPILTTSENQTAYLMVVSTPKAHVFINGKNVGETPLNLTITPGNYTIQLYNPDYLVYSLNVSLRDGERKLINATLKHPTFKLRILTKEKGLEVYLDGELIGETPLNETDVPVGIYSLTIKRDGKTIYNTTIRGERGGCVTISLDPIELPGETSLAKKETRNNEENICGPSLLILTALTPALARKR